MNWVDTAFQSGNDYESNPNGSKTFGNYNESANTFFQNAVMGKASSNSVLW